METRELIVLNNLIPRNHRMDIHKNARLILRSREAANSARERGHTISQAKAHKTVRECRAVSSSVRRAPATYLKQSIVAVRILGLSSGSAWPAHIGKLILDN